MTGGGVVVVGDSLLDRDVRGRVERICPDAPAPVLDEVDRVSRPGGAALAAAIAAGLTTEPVVLVTPMCDDEAGRELAALVHAAGVSLHPLPAGGSTPEKIRLRSGDQTLVRLDRGGGTDVLGVPAETADAIAGAGAVLVADYGRGCAAVAGIRDVLRRSRRPVVWDPHPRGPDPVPGCRLLTPNAAELAARWGEGRAVDSIADAVAIARRAGRAHGAAALAVTMGRRGALLVRRDGAPLAVPVVTPQAGDPCGAGDCFAASTAVHVAGGALDSEAVTRAVSDASRFVAAGGAGAYPASVAPPAPSPPRAEPAAVLAARVRAGGGTVVAAGGCFDLLHAGHVALLQAGRALGDCLVVCLNSDRSVRRLKGPGRPVNTEADRAATLAALDCVDAVEIFDEDSPDGALRRLQPHIWVKGGDYDASRLPETATLAEWDGQAVLLPYLAGRSTTGMLARAATPPA